ncbi:MAG: glycosyltransferase family 39 protein [Candidatus Hadarchaeaceae archaeon]
MTSFNIATSLASALVTLTTFLMMRKLTKNNVTALVAAFCSAFIPASFRMFGELQKNAFGVALAPLSVFFLWRGLEGGKKLDLLAAGIVLGVIGLTHELVFGTLVIAYLSYLAFLLAYRRRIPWRELKAIAMLAIPALIICGAFYIGRLGKIGGMAGERPAAILMAQGELQQLPGGRIGGPPSIYRFYDEYIGQLLLVLAALGAGVAAYRRKPSDFFLLAWGMSAFIMAQPWVIRGYQWRFALMLATPMVLLAAIGLVEGIGVLFWKAGESLRALFGRRHSVKARKVITIVGRVAFLCLLLFVVIQQVRVSHAYAQTGQMLQPTITMGEYDALQEFHLRVGDAYVFGSGRYIYWADVVGLKGAIENREVWELSYLMRPRPDVPESVQALRLATEWYLKQQEVGENIYAIASSPGGPGWTPVLGNEEFFKLIFGRPSLRAYALSESFYPPPPPRQPSDTFTLTASELQPPPREVQEDPLALRVLLAPVYMTSGAAKFVVGVPLTVLLWVFLPCLGWGSLRRVIEPTEKLRLIFIVCGVVVLVLVIMVTMQGYVSRPLP